MYSWSPFKNINFHHRKYTATKTNVFHELVVGLELTEKFTGQINCYCGLWQRGGTMRHIFQLTVLLLSALFMKKVTKFWKILLVVILKGNELNYITINFSSEDATTLTFHRHVKLFVEFIPLIPHFFTCQCLSLSMLKLDFSLLHYPSLHCFYTILWKSD